MDNKTPDEAREVCGFWFSAEVRPGWWEKDADLDAEIRSCFEILYERAAAGGLADWEETARGALALVIVLDQFPRNMFRDSPRAFATDARARAVANRAVERGNDQGLGAEERLFLYIPFEHSEDLADQDRAVALIETLGDQGFTDYAHRHRDIIARFGRFPHRNRILGRVSTPDEEAFLESPGSSF